MFEMLMLFGFLCAGLSQMLPEEKMRGRNDEKMSAPVWRRG